VTSTVIRAQGLGKEYRRYTLGEGINRYATLRDSLTDAMNSVVRGRRRVSTTFWALQDVSFEVSEGDIVGIIGNNGAGKSTLLKILSRVTEPTLGEADLHGRVASLLEVGTGFHPELTGRENIFLNGAILGMRRAEIARKFDEIVSFSEIEQFIETPVKHYSSGMYLRLAFAVAAHLEPEILLIDEILAVGDAAFQQKCLGKMDEVAGSGRTVIFISHNLDAIQRLCPRCVLMDHGRIIADGPTDAIVSRYLSSVSDTAGPEQWIELTGAGRPANGDVRIVAARYSGDARLGNRVATGGPLEVQCVLESNRARNLSSLAITIYSRSGTKLLNADTIELGKSIPIRSGRTTVGIRIEQVHLNPGSYIVGIWIGDSIGHALDHIAEAFVLDVVLVRGQGFGKAAHGAVACHFDVVPDLASSASEPRLGDHVRSEADS